MPGLDLEDVIERKRDEEDAPRAAFSLDLDDVIAPQEADAEQPAPAAQQDGTGEGWLDFMLGAEDGLTLGNTKNLGKLGARVATGVFDMLSPSLERDGMAPEYVGPRGEESWLADLTDEAQETGLGKLGRAVGTGVTALGTGGAAGTSIAGQAAVGAALSSGAAAGESDGDLLAMLEAMPAGAALGAGGGWLGGRVGTFPTAKQVGKTALWGGGLGAVTSPHDPLGGAARGAAHAAGGRMLLGAMPKSLAAVPRALGAGAATAAGTFAGAVSPAAAQDIAYGNAPTMAWAVQSVLTRGDTGLAPADEQRLAEAMMDGDDDKLISANFALQMKNPGYAARLQRELESLQEEE